MRKWTSARVYNTVWFQYVQSLSVQLIIPGKILLRTVQHPGICISKHTPIAPFDLMSVTPEPKEMLFIHNTTTLIVSYCLMKSSVCSNGHGVH